MFLFYFALTFNTFAFCIQIRKITFLFEYFIKKNIICTLYILSDIAAMDNTKNIIPLTAEQIPRFKVHGH